MEATSGLEYEAIKNLMPDFTAQTGINVNFNLLPTEAFTDKIPLMLAAHDSSFDVFANGSENIGHYLGIQAVEPLDKYLNDPAQTPASWNFKGIPEGVEKACQYQGQTYCIPSSELVGMIWYNKKMFADAGITSPPQTIDQFYQDAIKLTTPDHAGFCLRGSPAQIMYSVILLMNWFAPYQNDITGWYFDKNWNFVPGESPYAHNFGQFWSDITQKAGPKGIQSYLYTDCLRDFQQGRLAMWEDASAYIPLEMDPTQSKTYQDVAWAQLPCPPVNPDHCVLFQPFGVWMNSASQHKGAAWQLIQYITSEQTQLTLLRNGSLIAPSRADVLKDPQGLAKLPPTLADALQYGFDHPNIVLLPFIPEGVAIITPFNDNVAALELPGANVDASMAKLTDGVNAIMKAAGYPKSVPGVNQ